MSKVFYAQANGYAETFTTNGTKVTAGASASATSTISYEDVSSNQCVRYSFCQLL